MLKLTVSEFEKLLESKDWVREEIIEEHHTDEEGVENRSTCGFGRKVSKIMHKGELITLTYTDQYFYYFDDIDSINVESVDPDNSYEVENSWKLEGCIVVDEDNDQIPDEDLDSFFNIGTAKNVIDPDPCPFDEINYIFDIKLNGKLETIVYNNVTEDYELFKDLENEIDYEINITPEGIFTKHIVYNNEKRRL